MGIKKIPGFLLIAMLSVVSMDHAHGQVFLTLEDALDLAFPGAERIVKKKVSLDRKGKVAIAKAASIMLDDPHFLFYVGMEGDRPVGYMVVDNVIGQAEPITYMVAFYPDGKVKRIEIMAYRESRGGEVRYREFMKQYEGKSIRDPLRVGDDIRNISGATLSTASISFGVKKLLAVFHYIFLGEIPTPRAEVGTMPTKIPPDIVDPFSK